MLVFRQVHVSLGDCGGLSTYRSAHCMVAGELPVFHPVNRREELRQQSRLASQRKWLLRRLFVRLQLCVLRDDHSVQLGESFLVGVLVLEPAKQRHQLQVV
uniref:(northern house mosquito) hypothetical protein n=1 Tax=Culex pipiens TaxID=7175 RepID=A0A8D8ABC9_CULPI